MPQLEVFALLGPLVVAAVLLVFFRDRTTWWELALLLTLSAGALVLTRSAMVSVNTSDTEYLGSYITELQYDEPWDEWITRTCTPPKVCTGSGKDEVCTQPPDYDCSYREYHEAEWRKIDHSGRSHAISEAEYNRLLGILGSGRQFVDMNRDFYHEDGDRYVSLWQGQRERLIPHTREHSYENKVQASRGLFKLLPVDAATRDRFRLYEYPGIDGADRQVAVLSRYPLAYAQVHPYEALNALLGAPKQVRVFVLLFEGQPREAALWQRHYWQGGNKNELVVCLGVNSQRQVTWADAFSWEANPLAEIKIRDLFLAQPRLDLAGAAPQVEALVVKYWHRKAFADFDYLEIELTRGQLLGLYFLVTLVAIAIGAWAAANEHNPEGGDDNRPAPPPYRYPNGYQIPAPPRTRSKTLLSRLRP